MGSLSEVRAHVGAALDALGVPVYIYPPGAVQPPCVLLMPGSPYVDPGTAWASRTVNLTVRIVVGDSAGADAQSVLDDLIDATVAALAAVSVSVPQVPAPADDPDQGVLTVDIPTSTVWKDD